eukprot:TRINITY_DN57250_c0_g1_i2.p1 TRINITY_DN57250_c0_g1~~TRINITY_DN57250_c0_g1_i2.p1  ORF type:complete len:428 (+),score=41.96 TRINITY_DN57250_c0_g1_i2:56-1339(+)
MTDSLNPSVPDSIIEVIPSRFTFWSTTSLPQGLTREADGFHFFALDERFDYEPFASDFGPFKLSMIYQYCSTIQQKLTSPALAKMNIVHYCSTEPNEVSNVICLICLYFVIVRGARAEDAFKPFLDANVNIKPFCDASGRRSTFPMTIMDCLQGMQRAIEVGWFDWHTFDVNSYEFYDKFDHYGVNWIIPNKLLAFAGPTSSVTNAYGDKEYVPEDYIRIFHEADVGLVIRLNSKEYEEKEFTSNGINHLDLFFEDGSCPSPEIISKFLLAVEGSDQAVAVHCKAGLGRTGTLIALYAMKHHGFPARDFIAWSRMCRPGCILGPQQHFLVDMEAILFAEQAVPKVPMIISDLGGELGQGERLCSARRGTKKCSKHLIPDVERGTCFPRLLQSGSGCKENHKSDKGTNCMLDEPSNPVSKGGGTIFIV